MERHTRSPVCATNRFSRSSARCVGRAREPCSLLPEGVPEAFVALRASLRSMLAERLPERGEVSQAGLAGSYRHTAASRSFRTAAGALRQTRRMSGRTAGRS
jgi:hypothetical protein